MPLVGQQSVDQAGVSGRVTDVTGAAIPGADITMTRAATRQTRTAESDGDGRFHFDNLPPGQYQLRAHRAGFVVSQRNLSLALGTAFHIPIVLGLASQNAQVTVEAPPPALDTARTQVAGTISHHEIASLPVAGRNYLDLALLLPGVAPSNTGSTQKFAETSAVPGQGISIGSQRNFSNSFVVDGLSANDDAAGLTGTFYDQDVVEQFQVVTAGGQAEFGRALGGYVNMVTKSGTDTLHGDVYGYLQNQRLNADNALAGAKLPMTKAQYGASLGGPLGHGHTYYFANFEQRELNQNGLITIAPSDVAAINSTLAVDGYAGPPLATGMYPNPVHSTNVFARLDRSFSSNDQFTARYSLYRVDSHNSAGAGGLSAVSAAAGLFDDTQNLALSNVTALSPQTANELRAQVTTNNLTAAVNDPIGPAVSISGVANFGTLSVSPTARRNWMFEAVDNLSHQAGAHALKAGVTVLDNQLGITFPRAARGSYAFASLADFAAGQYNAAGFTQAFGAPRVVQNNPNLGLYAQDSWTAQPNLTLNLGVRYDLQWLKGVHTDTNNVAPRLGFAWTPFASQRTVVRGGFGIFYNRVPLRALANALQSSGNTTAITPATFITASLSPQQAGAPAFPGILASLPPGARVDFTTMDPHMQNAYAEQANLSIERQMGRNATLSLGVEHVRGVALIIDVNQNPTTCLAVGGNNGCRAHSGYGNNKQYSPLADSQYDALDAALTAQPARWLRGRVSYTWSKALDDVGEFFFSSPVDNFNLWQDWGRSDDDQRQRLVGDAVLAVPPGSGNSLWTRLAENYQLGVTVSAYSPLPFNPVTGASTVQGTAARPLLGSGEMVGRNTGQGFGSVNLNARLSRSFAVGERGHLEVLAEAFNVLNHVNPLLPNATFGGGAYPSQPLPSFGQATAVADPREVQLALRFSF